MKREALDRERTRNKKDGSISREPEKVTTAGKQLQKLSEECSAVSKELLQELEKLKVKGSHKRRDSFRQALNSIWSQKQICALEAKLEGIRKQLDTTLSVCLRERIDALPSVHIPQPNDDMKGFIEENRQWQADLLNAVHQKSFQVNNPSHISTVLAQLDESARLQMEASFHRMVLSQLDFPNRPNERIEFVKRTKTHSTGYFVQKDWAGKSPLLTASFFLWNSGTAMQISKMGLVQSLLHQILKQRPQLTTKLFRDLYETYNPLGGRLPNWTWAELRQAFHTPISDKSLQLFLLIDGLDEFDGDHGELVDMIIGFTKLPNVKICVTSRPWVVFEDAFENQPSLLLERLTYDDIKLYISTKFDGNQRYSHRKAREPEYASSLIETVTGKVSGVFLWVYLAVQSLLEGLTNCDRLVDLQRRLDTIPADLEDLFDKILNSLDPFYFSHACQYFQIVRAAQHPVPLLAFYYVDDEYTNSAMKAEVKELTLAERTSREEEMRRRLNSRCKGLLESPLEVHENYRDSQVKYLHRTVKDFVELPHIWAKIFNGADDSFDPVRCLAQCSQ
ncbi:hypothetical protein AOQ84DRAFT_416018 [Glonium stellatum]|uniref:NACHT domain-containing protein n=1 Tax=Glonium stellatum TaxID=574774 RepID=A0A8E2ETF8_9PEZI|nr:hypothetical protein AOQ84DRAFT_416018 [Glonium stellatum]